MSTSTKRKSWFTPALLIEIPAVMVTFAMMLHITANAVLRTFWNNPLENTLEITQYWYLPIIAFLGFVAAQSRGQHIAADLIFERFPEVTKRYVLAVLSVLAAVTCAGFAYYGWGEAVHAREIGKTAGVSDLVAWQPYYLVPIAFGVMTLQLLYGAVRAIATGEIQHIVTDPDDALLLEELEELEAQEHDRELHPQRASTNDTHADEVAK